jgi:3-hydroxyisobutyrate dehydrogenase
MLRAGVIGLGKIGTPMARRVLDEGFPLAVRDRRPEAMQPLVADGARACTSAAEVARRSDVICVVVLDDEQVEQVLLGPQGIVEGAASDLVVCVSSTVRESTVFRLADEARPRGVIVIDAGVAGGFERAATGELVTTVGGSGAAFDRVQPVLQAFSKEVIHAGPLGAGMRLKLIKNLISYLAMIAGHEGMLLAEAAGIEAAVVRHVVEQTELVDQFFHAALGRSSSQRLAPDAAAEELAHALHFAEVARKDMLAIEDLGRQVGVDLPYARTARANAGRLFRTPDAPDGPDAPDRGVGDR